MAVWRANKCKMWLNYEGIILRKSIKCKRRLFFKGISNYFAGFEVPTAVVMKSSVLWGITPRNPDKVNRRFG
jgi:hypothetical protein